MWLDSTWIVGILALLAVVWLVVVAIGAAVDARHRSHDARSLRASGSQLGKAA